MAGNPLPGLSLNLSYAHLDSFVKSNKAAPVQVGQKLSSAPTHTIVLIGRYALSEKLSLGGAVTAIRDDRLYLVAPSNNPLARSYAGSYTNADLFAPHTFRLRSNYRMRTQLNLYNITDELYSAAFGTSKPFGFRSSTTLSW
ncbi:MAG: hypothetical protein ACREH8_07790 [Opitutaceae bacterium]